MRLDGKVAIVTGAASGIGYAIARRYVEAGGRVVIADIKMDLAEKAAREIGGPEKIIAIEMDVTSEEAVNAGVQIVYPLHEFPYSEWKKMLAIHLDGAFLTTKACLPHMYKQKSGSIIFMGSVHSKEASPLKAPYVTAKHGLIGLSRVLAKEGAPYGVRTNVICPGFVKTPLVEKQIPEQAQTLGISEEEVVKKVMLGQTVDGEFTTMEDIAEIALFFAAFPTNALTGQSLVASHGWCMN